MDAQIELVARLRAREIELVDAIFSRIRDGDGDGDASLVGGEDAEYVAGLRAAVVAAVEHALAGIELGEERIEAAPPEAVAQAHRAARAGVSVDTVLRRYVLGSRLLGDFLMQEADSEDFAGQRGLLREATSAQAAVLERLIAAITDEYARELERLGRSPERRRAERVQRVLAGGRCDAADLGYELSGWHLGVIASGVAAPRVLSALAATLGCRLLCVPRGEEAAWAWLGSGAALNAKDVERALARAPGTRPAAGEAGLSVAIGEPGQGVEGWRLTHRQAQAARRVALRDPRALTRYSDVALLASVLHDDALSGSLVEIYLSPLGAREDGGAVLRETLRAYFAAERNGSSAASALGVARHTVENRLRAIEERLGQSLRTRQAELEVALRLEELGADSDRARSLSA